MFYASTMAANAIGLLFFFIIARVVDVAAYGEIVVLTQLVYAFSVVTRAMQANVAQAVTAVRSTDVAPLEAGAVVLRHSLLPLLGGTALITLVGALLSVPVAQFLKLDSAWPVVLLGGYVATHFLLSGPRGVLLGSSRLYFLSLVTVIDPLLRLVVALALVISALGTSGALLGYVAGNVLAAAVAVLPFLPFLLRRRLPAPEPRQPVRAAMAFDSNFAFVLLANMALMILPSIDPVAIRRVFSEAVADTYSVAFLLGRIVMLSTNAVSWVVFSRTVHMRPGDPRLRRVLARGLALGVGVAGAMTIGYWVAPDLAAVVVGGAEHREAGSFVGLIGLEMVLFSVVSILGYYHLALRNRSLLVPLLGGLVLEAVLLGFFHATPQQIVIDTMITLGVLMAWIGLDTLRTLNTGKAANSPQRPRAAMVVHSHYPGDPRVRRETEALLEAGWEVDVICLPDGNQARIETVNGARVFRMPIQRNRMGSQLSYLLEYGRFFAVASLCLVRLHLQRPYQVVQVHNMPDFLVFVALLPRLLGARVVLDVHDLVPEFYALRYRLPLNHPIVRFTRWVQKISARFADHVLTAGEPFRRELIRNGVPATHITSVMNSPDPHLFAPRPVAGPPPERTGHFVLSYHGTLSEYNDLTVVLRALAQLRGEIPGLEFRIYGRGRSLPELEALAAELKLDGCVKFLGFLPLDEMPDVIASADLGVVPQRRSVFTSLNFPTKAFEYMALGVPVVMSTTPALDELFGHLPGIFFQPESVDELAALIRRFYAEPKHAHAIASQQQAVCAGFSWPTEKQRYVETLTSLTPNANPRLEMAAA